MDREKRILNEIMGAAERNRFGLHSMACTVTIIDAEGQDIADWVFGEGRVIVTPREAESPRIYADNFYWDGHKNYMISRGRFRGQNLDYAVMEAGRRDLEQWTPLAFAYRLNRGRWLDEALSFPGAALVDSSHDPHLGEIYRVQASIWDDEIITVTTAPGYNYVVMHSEGLTAKGDRRIFACSEFVKVNGYWAPQAASFTKVGAGQGKRTPWVRKFLFSDIRINTISSEETIWTYPVGSKMYDGFNRVKYTLEASGQWTGIDVP